MSKETLEAAFPVSAYAREDGIIEYHKRGMTLRDYFAAKAMHTTIQMNWYNINEYQAKEVARWSYLVADAMLEARK